MLSICTVALLICYFGDSHSLRSPKDIEILLYFGMVSEDLVCGVKMKSQVLCIYLFFISFIYLFFFFLRYTLGIII